MAILFLILILLIALFHDAIINMFKLLWRFFLWIGNASKRHKEKAGNDKFADLTEFIEQIEDDEEVEKWK